VKAELDELKARHPEPTTGKLLGFWKSKSEDKTQEKIPAGDRSPSESKTMQPSSTPSNPPTPPEK
jgi:hypothetical protein